MQANTGQPVQFVHPHMYQQQQQPMTVQPMYYQHGAPPMTVQGYPQMQQHGAPPPGMHPQYMQGVPPQGLQQLPPEPVAQPTPPPADETVVAAIEKMAPFVVRNGPAFEEKMRQEKGSDPQFSFLFAGPYYAYYRWIVHCVRHNIAPEQRQQMVAAFAAVQRPQQPQQQPQQPQPQQQQPQQPQQPPGSPAGPSSNGFPGHMQHGSVPSLNGQPAVTASYPQQPPPQQGTPSEAPSRGRWGVMPNGQQQASPLMQPQPQPQQQQQQQQQQGLATGAGGPPTQPQHALSPEDEHALYHLVAGLNGSTDSIRSAREWFLARLPGCGAALAVKLREHVHSAQMAASTMAVPQADAFSRALNIVYLINDVLFALAGEPPGGRGTPFRRELLRQLPTTLQSLATLAPAPAESEKAAALVRLWDEKGLFPGGALQQVHSAMADLARQVAVPANPPLLPPQPPQPPPQPQQPNSPLPPHGMPMPPHLMQQQQQPQVPGHPQPPYMMGMPPLHLQQGQPLQYGYPPHGVMPPGHQPPQQPGAQPPRWGMPPQGMVMPGMPPGGAVPPSSALGAAVAAAAAAVAMAAASKGQQLFPVAAGLASAAHQHGNDLETMPVGAMVSFIKLALKIGSARYSPIDIKLLPPAPPPHIEPGRLEVRVEEFYRRAVAKEDKRDGEDGDKAPEKEDGGRQGDSREKERGGSGRRSRSRSRDRDRRRGSSRERDRERRGSSRERDLPPSGSSGRAPESAEEKAIADDNIGHNLLKRLGWNEGAGLGAAGGGIAEPVKNAGQVSKAGLGQGMEESKDEFEAFRKNKSTAYHRY